MKLSVYNIKGKETSKSVNLDKEIFGVCSDYVLELRESNS